MTRPANHRSNLARLSVGGLLAVGLGAAGSAWACTPIAVLNVQDGVGDRAIGPPRSQVTLTATHAQPSEGMKLTLTQVSGPRETDGLRAAGPVQELGSMTVSKEMAASKTTAELTATVNPDRDGYYYFELLVVDAEGKEQLRNGAYQVATPRSTEGDVNPGDVNPGNANPGNANPGNANPGNAIPGNANPGNANPGNANPGNALADEAAVGGKQPVAAPEARPTQEQAPVRAPAARTPAANGSATGSTAPAPSAPQPTGAAPAPTTAATPISPLPVPLRVAPAGDLWSGIAPSAHRPSLLDTPTSAPSDGLPVGVGLLGMSTMALAGVGVFAGRRRFALVRRVRS